MSNETVLKAIGDHATATAETLKGMNSDVADLKARMQNTEQHVVKMEGMGGFAPGSAKSIGKMIAEDPGMVAMTEKRTRSASVPLEIGLKSIVGDTPAGGDTGFPVQPQRGAAIGNDQRRRLSLLDVLPTLPATSGSYEFVSLDGFTNASAVQAKQGDKKAKQDIAFELKSSPIATIAAVLPVAEQVLADAPGLGMFVQDKMTHAALDKAEAELIGGSGGSGEIDGLKGQATAFVAAAGTALPDAIGQAIAELDTNGYSAGLVIMSPADWQSMRAERGTDGQYIAGGWADGAAPSIWGVPVVTSSSMAAGEVMVLDTTEVAVLDRERPQFLMGYSEDGIERNILTCRMELRIGLAVFSPSAVLSVTVAA